jgi:hypothetical protein
MKRKRKQASFQDRLVALEQWRNKLVPNTFTGDGVGEHGLGKWCENQRTRLRRGKLTKRRREALDNAEFLWTARYEFVSHGAVSLDDRVAAIKAFERKYGHLDIPVEYGRKRTVYPMPVYVCEYCDERVVGDQDKWEHLRDEHLDTLRPEHRGTLALGSFVRNARYRAMEGTLSEDIRVALVALGVSLTRSQKIGRPPTVSFNKRLEALETFKRVHGHLEVPVRYTDLGSCYKCGKDIEPGRGFVAAPHCRLFHYQLGPGEKETCWRCGRSDCRKPINEVFPDGKKALWKRSDESKWEPRCKKCTVPLGETREISIHVTSVPRVTKGMRDLGVWVQFIRNKHAEGLLSEARFETLNEMGFVWRQRWFSIDERVDALKEFKEEHGHLFVPMRYTGKGAHRHLGLWCGRQRDLLRVVPLRIRGTRRYVRKSRLPVEHKKMLEAIGFEWNGRDKPEEEKEEAGKEGGEGEEEVLDNPFWWLENEDNFRYKVALVKHHGNTAAYRGWFSVWVNSFRPRMERYGEPWVPEDKYWEELDKVIAFADDWELIRSRPELKTLEDEKQFLLSGMHVEERETRNNEPESLSSERGEEEEEEKEEEKEETPFDILAQLFE